MVTPPMVRPRVDKAYANFDPTATYTVDYKILATRAPQIGDISCSYGTDIIDAVIKNTEAIESRQSHDSALDTLVDLSMYEKQDIEVWGKFMTTDHGYAALVYPHKYLSVKKTIPNLLCSYVRFACVNSPSGGITWLSPSDIRVAFYLSITNTYAPIMYIYTGKDDSIKSNLQTYGGFVGYSITADCRGRI